MIDKHLPYDNRVNPHDITEVGKRLLELSVYRYQHQTIEEWEAYKAGITALMKEMLHG